MDVVSYVDSVCTSMDDMVRALSARVVQLATTIQPDAELAEVQQFLTATFREIDEAFVELARDVAAAGIPDTDDGLEFTRSLQGNLKEARIAFREAGEDFVASLEDLSDFGEASKAFAEDVTGVTNELGDAFPEDFPVIDRAEQESETCGRIGGAGLPPA